MSVTAEGHVAEGRSAPMAAATMESFKDELGRLRATSGLGGRDKLVRLLGALMAGAGMAVILLCYRGATAAGDLRDQMELLVLAIFGLGLVLAGLTVFVVTAMQRFLRFWLLRMVYEQRDLVDVSG